MKNKYLEQIKKFESLQLSISDKWTLIRAYASALSDRDLLDLYCSASQNQVIKSLLIQRDQKKLASTQHRTIARLLKDFAKRESGWSYLRASLLQRYDFASLTDKRKIIESLLFDNKYDRKYAYSKLSQRWDPYFTEIITDIYEKYHDPECLKLFVKHYPKSYLQDKFDSLVKFYDYRYACYCMGPDFVGNIDRSKIKDFEWLQLMAAFQREVSPIEAENILYNTVMDKLSEHIFYDSAYGEIDGDFPNSRHRFSVMELPNVKSVVRCLGLLGFKDALWRFANFCEQVDKLLKNNDFQESHSKVACLYEVEELLPPQVTWKRADTLETSPLTTENEKIVLSDLEEKETGRNFDELKNVLSEEEWNQFCMFRKTLARRGGDTPAL